MTAHSNNELVPGIIVRITEGNHADRLGEIINHENNLDGPPRVLIMIGPDNLVSVPCVNVRIIPNEALPFTKQLL